MWFNGIEFSAFLSELIGYKSGIALTQNDLCELVSDEEKYESVLKQPDEAVIRIRSEELESLVGLLLYRVGHIESPEVGFSFVRLIHKYKHNEEELAAYMTAMELFTEIMPEISKQTAAAGKKAIDPSPFIKASIDKAGKLGGKIAIELLEGYNRDLYTSPYILCRRIDWVDTVDLMDLFKSESLVTQYGKFVDQRYIDYLHRNFEKINDINWRKFEGLTGEFFTRNGFHVEIGPGRDDGGVDLRIWPSETDINLPPLILVQCKRQRSNVEKVIVKALWADVLEENAQSGLIVTTSALSIGADKVCKARGYPVCQANRETLKIWIKNMKTPGEGVYMGL